MTASFSIAAYEFPDIAAPCRSACGNFKVTQADNWSPNTGHLAEPEDAFSIENGWLPRPAGYGQDPSLAPPKRWTFERLLSTGSMMTALLAPASGVGGEAVHQGRLRENSAL